MRVIKVISGGQTGADQGALFAARDLGLKTGGYMPKDFRTEIGSWIEANNFHMDQTHAHDYRTRTRFNIEQSDGTLVFGRLTSPGCTLTRQYATAQGKPLWCVQYSSNRDLLLNFAGIKDWLNLYRIVTLNVAGNRESGNPGIFKACRNYLTALLKEHNDEQ